MSLVVEDGTGLSNAESYAAVADADSYWTTHGAPTAWTSGTTANKELALRLATQYLDRLYEGMWVGQRKLDTQSLAWPRSDAYDFDGYLIDDDSLPTRIVEAAIEVAFRQISGDSLTPDIDTSTSIQSQDIQVGPIKISKQYQGVQPTFKRYTIVTRMVRGLTVSGVRAERG